MKQIKPAYCKTGRIKHWSISFNGELLCDLDPDYTPDYRVVGKNKKYRQVQLMFAGKHKWFYVHRLVAFSWLPRPQHKALRIVDHRDGNSLNNAVSNIRFVTCRANNINKKCCGVVERDGLFIPRIMGYEHIRYGSPCKETAQYARELLAECYVRYCVKYPDREKTIPHNKISAY